MTDHWEWFRKYVRDHTNWKPGGWDYKAFYTPKVREKVMAMNYETLDKKIDALVGIWGKRIFDTQDRIHELKELREETENRISHIRSVQEPWNVDVIKRLELLEQDDSNVTTRRDMAIGKLSGRLDELEYVQDNLGVEVGVVGWLKNLQTTVEGLQTSMVQAQGNINVMWPKVMAPQEDAEHSSKKPQPHRESDGTPMCWDKCDHFAISSEDYKSPVCMLDRDDQPISEVWGRICVPAVREMAKEEPLYGPALTAEDDTEGPDSLYVDGWVGWPEYLRRLADKGSNQPLMPTERKELHTAAGVIDQLINYVKKMEEGGR